MEGPHLGEDAAVLARRLLEEGLVILPDPLDTSFVARLRDAFLRVLMQHAEVAEPNRGASRHQMYLPFEPPFDDPALWGDPRVLAVVEGVLGPDFDCIYCASDTPSPGSDYQSVHQDCDPLFAEWDVRIPPFCLVMNVPLVDVDDRNGPLEWYRGHGQPAPDAVPERVTGSAGTVLLRDARVWHRGTPNRGDAPRPTLTLIYARSWYRYHLDRPTISRRVYERLPDPGKRLFRSANLVPPLEPARADGPVEFAEPAVPATSSRGVPSMSTPPES